MCAGLLEALNEIFVFAIDGRFSNSLQFADAIQCGERVPMKCLGFRIQRSVVEPTGEWQLTFCSQRARKTSKPACIVSRLTRQPSASKLAFIPFDELRVCAMDIAMDNFPSLQFADTIQCVERLAMNCLGFRV
ncbi:hypothetical protein A1D31_40070 [Bradyrhizobium liaoningense]|nr:hypothetical protein A1D31_40070 [Bradyrhizobium liaoningense]